MATPIYLELIRKPILWALLIVNVSVFGFGQTTALQDEVADAEARAAIAKAKKEELDSKFPKPDASTLVGGTKVSGEMIESKILGYCAMKKSAFEITKAITSKVAAGSTFVVYNQADVKMLARYQLMMQRLALLKTGYINYCTSFGCGGGGVRLFGVGLVANKVLDFLSLLKTDIEITGAEFDIGEKELVAALFNNMQGHSLYYPQRIPIDAINLAPVGGGINSALLNEIINLGQEYDKARNGPANATRDNLDVLYESTMTELGLGKKDVAAVAPVVAPACPGACASTTVQTTNNINVSVGDKEKDEGGGGGNDKTLFSYLQSEGLYIEMSRANAYWLDLQVVKAGGNMRVKSNFITNFMVGSRVTFSGGAIVYFNVFDKQGLSKVSGVIPFYQKYQKSSQINETCKKEEGEN